jgi:hypothetical protein
MLHNAGMQPFGTSWDFWDRIARPEIRRARVAFAYGKKCDPSGSPF